MYIIDELINDTNIKSDVFNVSDDSPLTTNELINIMNQVLGKKVESYTYQKPFSHR